MGKGAARSRIDVNSATYAFFRALAVESGLPITTIVEQAIGRLCRETILRIHNET